MIMWGQPAFICALLASAVLLRRMPLIALGVTMAGLVVLNLAPKTELPASALQIVAASAAGIEVCYMAATRTRRVSGTGVAIAGIGLPILILELPPPTSIPPNGSSGTPIPLVTIAVPLAMIIAWLIGNSIRQAQARAELVRAQAAAQTVVAERLRIARELHDMVAHSIGIIAIQAGSGRRVCDTKPAEARDALAAIEATSRETLSGLRRMMTGLRRAEAGSMGPGPGQAPLGPAPGLADVDRLAAMTRDAGVRVEVEWLGSREPLPADIDLSAFRIIQEAVTNVVRHAGTDRCLVWIDQQDGYLSIEVTDSGRGAPASKTSAAGTGYGITGMRERAALLGGDFSAGPHPGGGFRVAARLPLPAPAR
ncbi:MAG TPA: sensor histidine kinase [Streptosporangiaceae bacterium]|nr:sensor histidine kinase [Streptosporangiaceae bacterium]